MFGYDMSVILTALLIFIVTSVTVSLVLIVPFGVKTGDTVAVSIMVAVVMGLMLSVSYPPHAQKDKENGLTLYKEVAKALDITEKEVEKTSITKPGFDYTFKVDKALVGVEYDFEKEEIISIISNDKYLYEREEK